MNTILSKIISITLSAVFFITSCCYGLAPINTSHSPKIKREMHSALSRAGTEPNKKSTLCVEFLSPYAKDISLVGGKGASLAELAKIAEIAVPEGFAITTVAYDMFIRTNDILPLIEELEVLSNKWIRYEMEGRLENSQEMLSIRNLIRDQIGKIRRKIQAGDIPQEIKNAVRAATGNLTNKFGRKMIFAIRSSATAEDLPFASFAGQHDTFFVNKEEMIEHIRKCWLSLYNDRAVDYRNRQRMVLIKERLEAGKDFGELLVKTPLRHSVVKLSVVVQRMIQSSVSGVGFNVDKGTGQPGISIQALYGMGEALVQGLVSPDSWFLNVEGKKILRKSPGHKTKKLIFTSDGCEEVGINEQEVRKFCLTDGKVKEIAHQIYLIGRAYKKAHRYEYVDTEFTLDENGKIYFVQARPETVHSREAEGVEGAAVYDKRRVDKSKSLFAKKVQLERQKLHAPEEHNEEMLALRESMRLEKRRIDIGNNVRIKTQLINDSILGSRYFILYAQLKLAMIYQELIKEGIQPTVGRLYYLADGETIRAIEENGLKIGLGVKDPLNLFENLTYNIKRILKECDNATIADIVYILGNIESEQVENILIEFMNYLIEEVKKLDLVNVIKDDKLRGVAARILLAIKSLGLKGYRDVLIEIKDKLNSPDIRERIWSTRVIEASRIGDKDIIKALMVLLSNTEGSADEHTSILRGMAVNALSTNRNPALDDRIAEELLKQLEIEQSYEVRFRAARGLRRFRDLLKDDKEKIKRIVRTLEVDWKKMGDLQHNKEEVTKETDKENIELKQKELEHVLFFTIITLSELKAREAIPILKKIGNSPSPPSFLPPGDKLDMKAREGLVLIHVAQQHEDIEHTMDQLFDGHVGYFRHAGFYDGVNNSYSKIINNLVRGGKEPEPERKRHEVFGNLAFYSMEEDEYLQTVIDNAIDLRDLETSLFLISHAPTQRMSYRGPCVSAPPLHLPNRDINFTYGRKEFEQITGDKVVVTKGCGINASQYGFGFKLHEAFEEESPDIETGEKKQYRYIGTSITLFNYNIHDKTIQNVRLLSQKEARALHYILQHENLLAIFLRICHMRNIERIDDVNEVIDAIGKEGYFTEYGESIYLLKNIFSESHEGIVYHKGLTPYLLLTIIKGIYGDKKVVESRHGDNWLLFIPQGEKVMNIHRRHMELAHLRNPIIIPSNVPEHLTGKFIKCYADEGRDPIITEIVYRYGVKIKETRLTFSEYVERFVPQIDKSITVDSTEVAYAPFVASCANGSKIVKITKGLNVPGLLVAVKNGIYFLIYLSRKSYEYFSSFSYKKRKQLIKVTRDHIMGEGKCVGRALKAEKIDKSILERADLDLTEPTIIVTENTDPDTIPVIMALNVVGLITKEGGKTSHPALVAHEYGIPALLGIGENHYNAIKNGANILLELDREGKVFEVTDVQSRSEYIYAERSGDENGDLAIALIDGNRAILTDIFGIAEGNVVGAFADAREYGIVETRKKQSRLCWNTMQEFKDQNQGFSTLIRPDGLFTKTGEFKPRHGVSEVYFIPRDTYVYFVGRWIQEQLERNFPDTFKTGENLHFTILGLQTGQTIPVDRKHRRKILEIARDIPKPPENVYIIVSGIYIDPNGAVLMEVISLPVDSENILQKRQEEWQRRLDSAKKSPAPFHITLGLMHKDLNQKDLEKLLGIVGLFKDRVLGVLKLDDLQIVHHHDNLLNNYDLLSMNNFVSSNAINDAKGEDDKLQVKHDETQYINTIVKLINDSRTILEIQQHPERWELCADGAYTNGFAKFNVGDKLIFDSQYVTIIYSPNSQKIFVYCNIKKRVSCIIFELGEECRINRIALTKTNATSSEAIKSILTKARINVKFPYLYQRVIAQLNGQYGIVSIDIGGTYIKAALVVLDDDMQPQELKFTIKKPTPKVNRDDFYRNISDIVQEIIKNNAKSTTDITVLPILAISMVGTFKRRQGEAYIVPDSANCFGLSRGEFDNSYPSRELSQYLKGFKIIVDNDALSQFFYGAYSLFPDLRSQKIAYIGIGTGLGSAFGRRDKNGKLQIYPNLMVNKAYLNPENRLKEEKFKFSFKGRKFSVLLSPISHKILSGRGVARLMEEIDSSLRDNGIDEVFLGNYNAEFLNGILEDENNPAYELALQIAEYLGEIMGRVACLIYEGNIVKRKGYAQWSDEQKAAVRGTRHYVLGGSIGIKAKIAEIIKNKAKSYTRDKLGISLELRSIIHDPDRASLLGAIYFVDNDIITKAKTIAEIMRYKAMTDGRWLAHFDRLEKLLQGDFYNQVPITVHITPSLLCNLHCVTCSQGRARYQMISEERQKHRSEGMLMSRDNMIKFIEDLSQNGVREIIFTGAGEPLTNSYTIDGMRYAKERGLKVGLLTNGVLLNEDNVEEILNIETDFVRISLDAGTPTIYKLFHGLKDDTSYKRVMKNLEYLVKRNLELGKRTVVSVNVVVTPLNIYDCANVAQIIKEIEDKFPGGIEKLSFKPAINYRSGHFDPPATSAALDYVKSDDRLKKFYEIYKDLFKTDKQLPEWFFDEVIVFIEQEVKPILSETNVEVAVAELRMRRLVAARKPFDKCFACSLLTFIAPDGTVYHCPELSLNEEFAYGNLTESPFREIWEGGRRREVINLLNEKGLEPCFLPVCCLYEYNEVLAQINSVLAQGQLEADDLISAVKIRSLATSTSPLLDNNYILQHKFFVVSLGDVSLEFRKGGKVIAITHHPAPTKQESMQDFLNTLRFKPQEGAYFGNKTSLGSRDFLDIKGLTIYAVDENQQKVNTQKAEPIGIGPEATESKLKEILNKSEYRFLGFDVDDTLLGKKEVEGKIVKETLDDRKGLKEALIALIQKGVNIVIFTDNTVDVVKTILVDVLVEELQKRNIPLVQNQLTVYADAMITKFNISPNYTIKYDTPYQKEKARIDRATKERLLDILGVDLKTNKIINKGVLGRWYFRKLTGVTGELAEAIKSTYPNYKSKPNELGQLVTVQRLSEFPDGSVAQVRILPVPSRKIGAKLAEGELDEREKLVRNLLEEILNIESQQIQPVDKPNASSGDIQNIDKSHNLSLMLASQA